MSTEPNPVSDGGGVTSLAFHHIEVLARRPTLQVCPETIYSTGEFRFEIGAGLDISHAPPRHLCCWRFQALIALSITRASGTLA
jgi:hypothetical protein